MSSVVLDKVRKLLAKAEDPACTAAEAAAFTDKAAELIARYGVDRALLAARDPATDAVADRIVQVLPPYAREKFSLLAGVAAALRCRSILRDDDPAGRRVFSVHLFGFGSDLERVELLFTSLLVQAAYGLAATAPPALENLAAFRRSWLTGFARAVCYRLREAEQRATTAAKDEAVPGTSMALVLADRSGQVERRVSEVYPRLTSLGPRRLAGSGMWAGMDAGRRADLGGARVSSRGRAALRG
jgi:hypothetical protein